jgi:hypothetical protein
MFARHLLGPFLSMLAVAGPAAAQQRDSVLAKARRIAAELPDTGAARERGFGPLTIGQITDLSPFQGQHWLHRWRVFGGSGGVGVEEPSFVMFVPVGGMLKPVGLAYTRQMGKDSLVPTTLSGAQAAWHLHQACFAVPGEGIAIADGQADCRARGGAPRPPEFAMVHAWTIPNPEGPFSHDNVALPYWAVGLPLPTAADLRGPRGRPTRALGLALGESYGAKLPYARLVESVSELPRLRDSLEAHRAVIRSLVPALRAGGPGRAAARDRAIKEWEALRRLYLAGAPSAEVRAQLEREVRLALGEGAKPGSGHHDHQQ